MWFCSIYSSIRPQSLQYAMPLLYIFGAHQAISERSLILECESGNAALPRNSNSPVNGGHMTRQCSQNVGNVFLPSDNRNDFTVLFALIL